MDAAGPRVRLELSTQAATPYHPRQHSVGGGGGQSGFISPYQPERWLGQVPAGHSMPVPTAMASASAGIPVPSGPPGDGGLGVMPPATALASVPLLGGGDVANVAALAPTLVLHQESVVQLPPLESPAALVSPLQASQLGLGVSQSPSTAPFPQKLVDKARSRRYVDMRDLLMDNASLSEQLDFLGGSHVSPTLPGTLKPRFREITSLSTWAYCFLAYVALQSDDPLIRDRLAYARLIIREAQRHRGSGWLDYDKIFRQQAVLDSSMKWNLLHPAIQASTLIGQTANSQTFCRLCREPDHNAGQCALVILAAAGLAS